MKTAHPRVAPGRVASPRRPPSGDQPLARSRGQLGDLALPPLTLQRGRISCHRGASSFRTTLQTDLGGCRCAREERSTENRSDVPLLVVHPEYGEQTEFGFLLFHKENCRSHRLTSSFPEAHRANANFPEAA